MHACIARLSHLRLRSVCLIPDTTLPRLIGAFTARGFLVDSPRRRSASSTRSRGSGRASIMPLGESCSGFCSKSTYCRPIRIKKNKLSLCGESYYYPGSVFFPLLGGSGGGRCQSLFSNQFSLSGPAEWLRPTIPHKKRVRTNIRRNKNKWSILSGTCTPTNTTIVLFSHPWYPAGCPSGLSPPRRRNICCYPHSRRPENERFH